MALLHALLGVVIVVCGLSVPRGVAWLTALFGSQHYSDRAMRLLRRPPLPGTGPAHPADPGWRVARMCNGGSRVRVAPNGDAILIGDSKNPDGPVLSYTRDELRTFVEGVRQGDFDDIL